MKKLFITLFSLLILVVPGVVVKAENEIALNKSNLDIEIEEGSTKTATLTATLADGITGEVSWSSSDSDVASVSGGTVTAKKEGTATITASITYTPDGETDEVTKTATCTVKVTKKVVEPEPEEEKDYTIVITGGTLDKTFDKDKTDYTVTVTDEKSFSIKPKSLTDAEISYNIPNYSNLRKVGAISVTIEGKKYTLKIVVPTADVYLSKLEVKGYSLNETFDKDKTDYTVTVPNDVESVTINATPEDSDATVTPGKSFTKDGLQVGSSRNNTVTIKVTNGDESKTYTIYITRKDTDDKTEVKDSESDENITSGDENITSNETSSSTSSLFDIPDVDDPDSPLSMIIITLGSLMLVTIGGIGIYFFVKTSPRRMKKELLKKKKNEEESPIVEIEPPKETKTNYIETLDDLEETKEFKR